MSKFPQTPSFTGFNTPSRIEADIVDLDVEGDIPAALEGAFYRVQPDPQFPPLLGDDIAFNGDGMITMFRFDKGRVSLKQRWARTNSGYRYCSVGRSSTIATRFGMPVLCWSSHSCRNMRKTAASKSTP